MTDKIIDKTGWNYTIVDNHIIENENLDIYEKMLYISLKRFANLHTQEAFPGVKKIASYAGMSERKARSTLTQLEEKKLVTIERRINKTSIYTLLPTVERDAGGAHGAGGVVHTVQGGGAHGADELKKDELKKLRTIKNIDADASAHYEKIISHLNEKTSTNYRSTSEATRRLIKARLNEGFGVDDFMNVIDNKTNDWKNDPAMSKYLRPVTLFGTKFESYLNEQTTRPGQTTSTRKPVDTIVDINAGEDW